MRVFRLFERQKVVFAGGGRGTAGNGTGKVGSLMLRLPGDRLDCEAKTGPLAAFTAQFAPDRCL